MFIKTQIKRLLVDIGGQVESNTGLVPAAPLSYVASPPKNEDTNIDCQNLTLRFTAIVHGPTRMNGATELQYNLARVREREYLERVSRESTPGNVIFKVIFHTRNVAATGVVQRCTIRM